MNLDEFKKETMKATFGNDAPENKAKGLCINCKQPALENCYSTAGVREFKISGLCEKCFDKMTESEL